MCFYVRISSNGTCPVLFTVPAAVQEARTRSAATDRQGTCEAGRREQILHEACAKDFRAPILNPQPRLDTLSQMQAQSETADPPGRRLALCLRAKSAANVAAEKYQSPVQQHETERKWWTCYCLTRWHEVTSLYGGLHPLYSGL